MPTQTAITLESIKQPIQVELDGAFAELGRIVQSDFSMINDVNTHLLQLRGKLFRPTLALLSAKVSGEVSDKEATLAAIVELIHLATLVHDDSVDHSALRRGQPTINSMFSHQVAVIMGDYLYSRAIVELVNLDSPRALKVMSRVTNDMTIGEMRQLQLHDALEFTEADYDLLIQAKTASLMSGACEVGALAGKAPFRDELRKYGLLLGMAFQVTDDVLDYTGTEAVTGKPSGLDLREHKITLPLILALPFTSDVERTRIRALMDDPEPSEESVQEVVAIVSERGGIKSAQARAGELAQMAQAEIENIPPSDALNALSDCITYAIERRR
jgi:octaprenyl-diphosphate synthase